MGKTFPKLMKDNKPQIQGVQRASSKVSTQEKTPRHVVVKLFRTKGKEKDLGMNRKNRTIATEESR